MTFTAILILLIITVILSSLGQWFAGYTSAGWVASTVMGLAGAFLGLWVAGRFNLPRVVKFYVSSQAFPLVWVLFFAGAFVIVTLIIQQAIMRRLN